MQTDRLKQKPRLFEGKNVLDDKRLMWREQIEVLILRARILVLDNHTKAALELLSANQKLASARGNKLALIRILGCKSEIQVYLEPELVSLVTVTGLIYEFVTSTRLHNMLNPKVGQEAVILSKVKLARASLKPRENELFTHTELEVVSAINANLSDKGIAKKLDVSTNTVRFHIKNIFRKTNAHERIAAAKIASERLGAK